jgi:hypothetical protein
MHVCEYFAIGIMTIENEIEGNFNNSRERRIALFRIRMQVCCAHSFCVLHVFSHTPWLVVGCEIKRERCLNRNVKSAVPHEE